VRDVLVWSKAPFLFRDELVPMDRLSGERQARPGEVKRMGDTPVVLTFASGHAEVEVSARAEHRALVTGSFVMADGRESERAMGPHDREEDRHAGSNRRR
jgi:hypothetical protein